MADSTFSHHEACPRCQSSDALARYTSGWGFCYSCQAKVPPEEAGAGPVAAPPRRGSGGALLPVDCRGVRSRGLTDDTCRRWRYGWAHGPDGELVQVAQYADRSGTGRIVAQKTRTRDKDFAWVGNPKSAETLYGRHLWRDGGKRLIVTEGEIDALSVDQIQDHKWPVVSLAGGAGSAERAFRDNLEWLEAFDQVVLMFDQDDAGREAAEKAAAVLSPGKALVATLPLKDANALLQANRGREVISALWEARAWRPDGILQGQELWDRVSKEIEVESVDLPWQGLQRKLRGLRRQEILTLVAGTGVGKSTICRELAVHLIRRGERVGWIGLEEGVRAAVLGMLSVVTSTPLRLETADWEALEPTWKSELAEGLCVFDHWGSVGAKELMSRVRYLVKGLGCGWVVLDHISIAVSGIETENERKDIDVLMTGLRRLVQETGAGMILVSQLRRRPDGKDESEGFVPRLSDIRGSASIAQLSDSVVALGRRVGGEAGATDLHVLKNRLASLCGPAGALEYDVDTGRYIEVGFFEEIPEDGEDTP